MEIFEEKIYLFKFTTDAGDIQIPIRAHNKDEAIDKIQKMLGRIQAEIAMEQPKVTDKVGVIRKDEEVSTLNPPIELILNNIPPEVLELRINTLLLDMGAGELKDRAKADTIKLWTELEFTPNNYIGIITELELIRTGKKDIPVKKKK